GGAIQWQRWQGTLEVLVAAPTPFVLVMAPLTLATPVMGYYSLYTRLVGGGVPATVPGPRLLGFVFASTFVLYRHANALSNMLEWPVLLVTGMLVPLSLLPAWSNWISWILAPTWGVQAIREAALGGTPWPDIGMTLVLGLAYLAIGAVCLRHFETAARRHATLSLT